MLKSRQPENFFELVVLELCMHTLIMHTLYLIKDNLSN